MTRLKINHFVGESSECNVSYAAICIDDKVKRTTKRLCCER